MRILFVESYPQVVYGQQRTMFSLLEQASAVDIEPLVAVPGEGSFVDEAKNCGYSVELFHYPELLRNYSGAVYRYKGLQRATMYWQWIKYVWSLRDKLRALHLNGVFCNDMRGLLTLGLAARSIGLPLMIWDKNNIPHGLLDYLQLPLVQENPIISKAVLKKYPQWQQNKYQDKIHVVPNGADLTRFVPAKNIRHELPVAEDDFVLGIVGSICERKAHDRLLGVMPEACNRIPNLHLIVIGDTSGSEADEKFKERLPNRDHPHVHFLGMRKDVPDLLKSINALVIPSRFEGMGQVTVEAMAAGLPVIGAQSGGIPEVVVDGETGLIFDGDDPDALLSSIESMASSPELCERMGAAGRKRVKESFNRPIQIRKILDLCLAMVEKHEAKK